jgi:hypothetical protein
MTGKILSICALLIGSRFPSLAQSPPSQAGGYKLVFGEDFRHFDLSPDGAGSHNWYEGVWFNKPPAPLDHIAPTSDGLRLTWTRDQVPFDTSISTMGHNGETRHAWQYGYFEVRVKWTPTTGAWPAIWLIPAKAGHQIETGEADIFEGNGDNPHTYYGTIHHWHESPDHSQMLRVQSSDGRNHFLLMPWTDFTQYHTYGLLWEPGRFTWYLDDHPLHSEPAFPVFNQAKYCLIIGMQAGADWKEGNIDKARTPRMDMDVSWVHIWQR